MGSRDCRKLPRYGAAELAEEAAQGGLLPGRVGGAVRVVLRRAALRSSRGHASAGAARRGGPAVAVGATGWRGERGVVPRPGRVREVPLGRPDVPDVPDDASGALGPPEADPDAEADGSGRCGSRSRGDRAPAEPPAPSGPRDPPRGLSTDVLGSGEPGRLFVGRSLGSGPLTTSEDRTAAPSIEPVSSVSPATTIAITLPRRSTRRRSCHSSDRGPSRRHASPASRASAE